MNTLSINTTQSLFTRFAWKEYRMLRGFCLAGFVIAFVLQWFLATVASIPGTQELELFTISWAAAALYIVGAAITMFCAETEERTRDYLRLLPGDWRPIFATKIFMSLVSAMTLGCALSLTGWWLAGYLWPQSQDIRFVFAIAGVAIVEGLAWGLLFSLWWKQPLLAAVAAIAFASLGSQLAILGTITAKNVFSLEAYQEAVPSRLLICAALFFVDVWIGRQWLYPQARADKKRLITAKPTSDIESVVKSADRPQRKMFSRLLWQTWRESWQLILVVLPLSFGLMAALMIPAYIRSTHNFLEALPFVALIPPALMGAFVFRADHQRDHRLFLATHSAWPRYVWFARQMVWFGTVLLLAIAVHFMCAWSMQDAVSNEMLHYARREWFYYSTWLGREFSSYDTPWTQAWRFELMEHDYLRALTTSWFAVIGAYGVGQLCSMLLKQPLLSGFLAILFASLLAAWAVLMFLWEMSPFWFVLPIGVVSLFFTWLRVPNWILGKNRWKNWLAPVFVFVVPTIVLFASVPAVRIAQVNRNLPSYPFLGDSLEEWNTKFKATRAEAAQTALEYERLLGQITNKDKGFLQHSANKNTPLMPKSIQRIAEQATKLSRKPYCQFPQQVLIGSQGRQNLLNLQMLLSDDALRLQSTGEFDTAFERLCAKLRITGQMMQGQTSSFFVQIQGYRGSGTYADTCRMILDWAQYPDQTSERLKSAIVTLEELTAKLPLPTEPIYADRNHVRKILLDEELPTRLEHFKLAVLNRFPGERKRSLLALDHLARQALNYCGAVESLTKGIPVTARSDFRNEIDNPRELLRHRNWDKIYAVEELAFNGSYHDFLAANQLAHACASSFLAAKEFSSTGSLFNVLDYWVDNETRFRALSVQLALVAYSLDHGEYPKSLESLVPDYLKHTVYDPYSNRPFKYRRNGLELPLVHSEEFPKKEVAANTPLLWSVGNANNKMQEINEFDAGELGRFEEDNMPVNPDDGSATWQFGDVSDQSAQWRTVFKFHPTENNLVFLLPKIETNESETGPQPDRNADPGNSNPAP